MRHVVPPPPGRGEDTARDSHLAALRHSLPRTNEAPRRPWTRGLFHCSRRLRSQPRPRVRQLATLWERLPVVRRRWRGLRGREVSGRMIKHRPHDAACATAADHGRLKADGRGGSRSSSEVMQTSQWVLIAPWISITPLASSSGYRPLIRRRAENVPCSLQLISPSCSFLSTDTLRPTLFSPVVVAHAIAARYRRSLSPPTLAPEFGCSVAHLALPIVPDDPEKRQAFLAPIAPRLPRWLPRSCPGLRPTTPSDGPRSCRPWSCRPSPRPRPPCSRTSCRRSGTTARGLRRVPPWRRTHRSVTAAMPRSSCQPCRPWRRQRRTARPPTPATTRRRTTRRRKRRGRLRRDSPMASP